MILRLPINSNSWLSTITRWGAEMRSKLFIGEEDLEFRAWGPEVTSSMTITDLVISSARYSRVGKWTHFHIGFTFTLGGAPSPVVAFTLPPDSQARTIETIATSFSCTIQDVVGGQTGNGVIAGLGNGDVHVRRFDGLNWTLGVNKYILCCGTYEAA